MEMRGKTNSIQLGIEILTPVQCGSGQELFKNKDYVAKQNQVFVVDQVHSFNEIASGNAELDRLLANDSDLEVLVDMAGYFGYPLPIFSRPNTVQIPDKIREHLKDAHFQPYLAGSALKGAIRTALIAEHLRSLPDNSSYKSLLPYDENASKPDESKKKPSEPKERADNKLLDNLLGKEPKQDIFRALHVKDAMFKTGDLCLVDIRWLNLTGNAAKPDAKWRNIRTRSSFSEWHDADGIYAEMLTPKSQASFQLQWDEFLIERFIEMARCI